MMLLLSLLNLVTFLFLYWMNRELIELQDKYNILFKMFQEQQKINKNQFQQNAIFAERCGINGN